MKRLLLFIGLMLIPSSQVSAQMRAVILLEHCTGPTAPDGICLGYTEAALDFITEYQLG